MWVLRYSSFQKTRSDGVDTQMLPHRSLAMRPLPETIFPLPLKFLAKTRYPFLERLFHVSTRAMCANRPSLFTFAVPSVLVGELDCIFLRIRDQLETKSMVSGTTLLQRWPKPYSVLVLLSWQPLFSSSGWEPKHANKGTPSREVGD